jgi:hypothetical protein
LVINVLCRNCHRTWGGTNLPVWRVPFACTTKQQCSSNAFTARLGSHHAHAEYWRLFKVRTGIFFPIIRILQKCDLFFCLELVGVRVHLFWHEWSMCTTRWYSSARETRCTVHPAHCDTHAHAENDCWEVWR